MKNYRYKGPEGEVEIKSPLPVRLVESSRMLTLWTLGFVIWGGYYLVAADPAMFLGKKLSSTHKQYQSQCIVCHTPFVGVTNEACQSPGCHTRS